MKKTGRDNKNVVDATASGGPSAEEMARIVSLFNEGDLTTLEIEARKITEKWPENGFGWKALGVSLKMQKKDAEAILSMRKAVELTPDDFDVYNNLASAIREQGQLEESIAYYRKALELRPNYPEALNGLGMALRAKGDPEEAMKCYETAMKLNPEYPEAYNNYGNALREMGKAKESVQQYTKALELRKDYVDALNGMGNAMMSLGNPTAAIQYYQKAVEIRPSFPEALNGLANALKANGQVEEAIAHYRLSIAARPEYHDPYHNLANVFRDKEDVDGAIEYYRKALAVNPEYHSAAAGLGMALMAKGELREGWKAYESRWSGFQQAIEGSLKRPETSLPQWRGEIPKPSDAILIFCEQGLGDSFQFIRYIPMVAARFSQVTVICPSALVNIFRGSFQAANIEITDREPKQQHRWQWQCPTLSLPLAFDTTLETVPAQVPYLKAPQNRMEHWQRKLESVSDKDKPRIGLVWAGGNLLKDDSKRSIPPHLLKPLLENQNFTWVSLQKTDKSTKKAQGQLASLLIDWMDEIKDFADTAALIENLDLVISVDTSVAHLAGALNKPTWLLNRFAGDWRWMTRRQDSPWYPSMRLFNQVQAGDWLEVIERVSKELISWQGLEASHPRSNEAAHKAPDFATMQHLLNLFSAANVEEHRNQTILLARKYPDPETGFAISYANILNGFGISLMNAENTSEAIRYLEESLMVLPDQTEVEYTLGCLYLNLRKPELAIQKHRQVLAKSPDHYKAHMSLSLALLMNGEWLEGWQEYEYRFLGSNYAIEGKVTKPKTNVPEWHGEIPVPDSTLLVTCEQGFGDAIQFVRYIEQASHQFTRLILNCSKFLIPLFEHSFRHIANLSLNSKLPFPEDLLQGTCYHCMLLSLPNIFKVEENKLTKQTPYLKAPADRVNIWRARIDMIAGERYRVGVVWKGNQGNTSLLKRSMPTECILPLLAVPEIAWINLQKENIEDLPADSGLIDWMDEVKDFADTAAIINELDLVISIDTSVAHLAGAMGKAVWLLNRWESDWRWMLNRQDSPWYPTMRIFNQTESGDWTSVIARVISELESHPRHKRQPLTEAESQLLQQDLQLLLNAFNQKSPEEYQALVQEYVAVYTRNRQPLVPHLVRLLNNFGYRFYQSDNHKEARKCFTEVVRLDPDNFYARHHLGVVLGEMREIDEAIVHLRKAVVLEPKMTFSRYTLASNLLAKGQFDEGWKLYEYRWDGSDMAMAGKKKKPEIHLPEWSGEADTGNDHLLLYIEQGFGDQFQFIRLLPRVTGMFRQVTVICSGPTLELFRQNFSNLGNVHFQLDIPASFEGYQWQCALISLPLALKFQVDDITGKSYLTTPTERIKIWQEKLQKLAEKPRVGFVYTGSSGLTADKKRSIQPELLKPLFENKRVHWVSLQKTDSADKTLPTDIKSGIHDWMDEVRDFADTAAIISQLDLVISVDTSIAHLAGALGKPVWLLNRHDSDWRWMLADEYTPWYDSMRIFNQPKSGDWTTVISRVSGSLHSWATMPEKATVSDQPTEEPLTPLAKTSSPYFSVDPVASTTQADILHDNPHDEGLQQLLSLLQSARFSQVAETASKLCLQDDPIALRICDIAVSLLSHDHQLRSQPLTTKKLEKSPFRELLAIYEEAFRHFLSVTASAKSQPLRLHKFASSLLARGLIDESIAIFMHILQLAPDFAEAITNYATANLKKGQVLQAIQLYREALSFKPDFTIALNGLGVACKMQGDFEDALQQLQKAVALEPENPELLNNLAATYMDTHQLDKAIPLFKQAVQFNPDYHVAHMGLALALLMHGDWEEGWQYYEYRWQGSHSSLLGMTDKPKTPSPQWKGEPVPKGSGLLVFCEQGIGDNFQFVRYLRLVAQRFTRVALLCPPALINILRGSFSNLHNVSIVDQVVDNGNQWQFHCHMMSLPLAFKTTLANVPRQVPYLSAPLNRVHYWESRLAPIASKKPRVGLVWAGGDKLRDDKERSIALAQLLPLLKIESICWVSLQKSNQTSPETAELCKQYLTDWMPEIRDFADTAALMETLDLVVSVDTSVAHLAGALAKPVWLFNRYSGDWRWMYDREDSPWYPSMRIFNQPKKGDWQPVVKHMASALKKWAKGKQPIRSYLRPQPPVAELEKLVQLYNDKKWEEMEKTATLLIQQYPEHGFAHKSLAIALKMLLQKDRALASFRRAAELMPQDLDVLNNLGSMLSEVGDYAEAKNVFDEALLINPEHEQTHINIAVMCYDMNDVEMALPHIKKALELNPDSAMAWFNYGVSLKEMNRHEEAIDCYSKALELDPNYVHAKFNRGLARLSLGQFDLGWQEYEERFNRPEKKPLPETPYPQLEQGVNIRGKRILIQAEQGFGDCIQMSRYARLLQEQGAECWLQVSHSLVSLMRRSYPGVHVLDAKVTPQSLDYRIPLMSLPYWAKTFSEAEIPHYPSYLLADVKKVGIWSERLPSKKPKIGLVWRGSSSNMNDHNRSSNVEAICALVSKHPEKSFISLQKDLKAAEREILNHHKNVTILDKELTNFDETAAVIANLDLVISVDSAVAHLTAALGKPAWIMLAFRADYRWMTKRPDSPWYPSVRLFRQAKRKDWNSIVEELNKAINQLSI